VHRLLVIGCIDRRAIDFWVEANLFTPTVVEVNHLLNFAALEVLANAFFDNKPKAFFRDRTACSKMVLR